MTMLARPTFALLLATFALPAAAQDMGNMHMPGMQMPAPSNKAAVKSRAKAKPVQAKPVAPPPAPEGPASAPAPAPAEQMPPMPGMAHVAPAEQPMTMPMDHGAMAPSPSDMAGMTMGHDGYGEGSGTSRLPADGEMMAGIHASSGGWMLMLHGYAWGVYTGQGGPRGRDEAFVESMAMLTGQRDLDTRTRLQLRAMMSLEPAMGQRGYPNLFATGETANSQPLVDRQHPHDLFMELSARIDRDVGELTAFAYGGPVAEPALGPSAFMHRASDKYLALSPISHHWFDSTHITYGVVTGGIGVRTWQLETSAFRGREPDERRWDIEAPRLDSWSVRATWTPTPQWAVQASHGRLESPEDAHPGEDEARTTASVHYAHRGLSAMLGWSAKDRLSGPVLTAWLAEANWDMTAHHSIFGRFENVANDELFPDQASPLHDVQFRVSRFEGGYAYRLPLMGPVGLALGGSVAAYAKPSVLDAAYGRAPLSYTLFAKLSLGR